tara:strand:- start:5359 stop:6738 length:1380 start_codon:yes stop_codon:yes gene_type:complete
MPTLLEQLRAIVGNDGVLVGDALSARAASYWDSSPLVAKALVRPRATDEVSAVLRLCHSLGQPVVTQGGGTGCVDGTVVGEQELVLSLERMATIEDIDPVGRTATVQAGAILQTVQEAVAEQGMLFPLDLGARGSCTIGGNVATNAGGISVIRYGMMRDLVLGLEVVLADGRVITSLNTMLKNNAGYDLKQLFIGTEGTLGIVTRVVLKLREAPVTVNSALVALETFEAVCGLLKHAGQRSGGSLSAFEVMWGEYYRAVTEPGWHRAPMTREHAFYVVLETRGADEQTDGAQFMGLLEQALEEGLIVDAVVPKSEQERAAIWAVREDFDAITAIQPTFLYDVSLPIRHMAAYITDVQERLRQRWPHSHCYVLGHIGDGNLHLFVTPGQGDRSLHPQVDEAVYRPLQPFGGSVSAEHGIGLEKKAWLGLSRTAGELDLMRKMKTLLDPGSLLNPGKVFDA